MLRSRIHLIGGGPGTLVSLRRHIKSALPTPARGRKPLVAYVGAASGDNAAFQGMIGALIVAAGARVQAVKLASPRAKQSSALAVLEDCDVVFVSGGDVEAGMNVLAERGVLPLFRRLAQDGRPMIGISAGSIMLGRAWVRFPEADVSEVVAPKLFPCMNLAPVYVDAHAEADGWEELHVLLHLLAASGEPGAVGYGLTRKGGVVIEQGEDGATLTPFGTAAPRFAVRGGHVVEDAPLPAGETVAVDVAPAPPRRPAKRR